MAPVKQLVRAALIAALVLVALPRAADAAITLSTPTNAHWSPGTGPTALLPDGTASSTGGNTIAWAYIDQNDFLRMEDELLWAPTAATGDIISHYNFLGGDLTLFSEGGATDAQWQAALRAIRYVDHSLSPSLAVRTVDLRLMDDAQTDISNTASTFVSMTATDGAPALDAGTGAASYLIGDPGVAVAPALTVADPDDPLWSGSATVAVSAGLQAGDELAFVNDDASAYGDIAAVYDAGLGVLTLQSDSWNTADQWRNALCAVTFSTTSSSTATRTVSFAASDGTVAGAGVTREVAVASPVPVIAGSTGSAGWTQADNTAATPVVVDGAITVADDDSTTLASGTVAITDGLHSGEDVLAFNNSDGTTFGNIDGSYSSATGELALTSAGSTATLAQWQNALRAVTYTDSAAAPDMTTRTVAFSVNDGQGHTSDAFTRTVTVARVDQTPVVTVAGSAVAFIEGDDPVAVDPSLTVADTDDTALPSATVTITGGLHADEDVLAFAPDGDTGDVAATYDAATGELALTSDAGASPLQWQAALRAVTYADTSEAPSEGTRTLTVSVDDGEQQSAPQTRDVAVAAVADAPTITGSTEALTVQAGGPAVAVDPALTVTDVDSPSLAFAVVTISHGYDAATDTLAWDNPTARRLTPRSTQTRAP